MPRQSRIDASGALYHIIVRGIERYKIFKDDADRESFVERPGKVMVDTQIRCYAWALIPNLFHLPLKTGSVPILTVMRHLLTGYAISYNKGDIPKYPMVSGQKILATRSLQYASHTPNL